MKFGIMLNHQFRRSDNVGQRLDELVEFTKTARDSDFDSVFVHHHYLAELATPQPLPLLSRLVPSSGSMRLGVGVYLVPFEHPIQLAENFATLDQLSGGRVVLGVGAGYRDDEFESFGVDRTTRGPRLVETIELVRALWQGERVDHDGRFFRVSGQAISVPTVQRPGPPIWIGASNEKTIRRAAHIGDAWLASPNVKPKFAIGSLAMFREELDAQGIDPTGREYPLLRELYIADTDEAALDEAEQYIRGEYLAFAEFDEIYAKHYEDMLRKAFLFGSADTVAAHIEQLAAGGFNHLIFRTNWPGMPADMTTRTIRRFAEEVMPRFRAVAA